MHYCIRCGKQLSLQTADGRTVCENCRTDYSSGAISFYREFGSVSFAKDCSAQWRETAEAGFCSFCGSEWKSKRVGLFCTFCGKPLIDIIKEPAAGSTEAPRKVIRSGSCGDYVRFTLDSDGMLIITGIGRMSNYRWYSSPFYKDSSVKTVVIEAGVTSIGDFMFRSCTGLTGLTIPNSVTSIGDEAFRSCTGLTDIAIPNSVTTIGYGAFSDIRNLKDIWIPAAIRKIGNYAFDSCPLLTIHGVPDSRAQKYAQKNGIPFSTDTVPQKSPRA